MIKDYQFHLMIEDKCKVCCNRMRSQTIIEPLNHLKEKLEELEIQKHNIEIMYNLCRSRNKDLIFNLLNNYHLNMYHRFNKMV